MGQHQRGAVAPRDDVGHGEGFAGAGDAQQRLAALAGLHAGGQQVDGLRLIAGGLIGRMQLESVHGIPPWDWS